MVLSAFRHNHPVRYYALVQYDRSKTVYVAKPLFGFGLFKERELPRKRRLQAAIDSLSAKLENEFKGKPGNLSSLRWLSFLPDVQEHRIHLSFMSGRNLIDGHFYLVKFDIGTTRIVLLPALDNELAILEPRGDAALPEQIQPIVAGYLRRRQKSLKRKLTLEDIQPLYSNQKELLLTRMLWLNSATAPLELDLSEIFSSIFGETQSFSGVDELDRMGRRLGRRSPDDIAPVFSQVLVQCFKRQITDPSTTALALIGAPGSGKTTLLDEVAFRIDQEFEPDRKQWAVQLWKLRPERLIAGMRVVGSWEARLDSILEYLQNRITRLRALSPGKSNSPYKRDIICFDNPLALLTVGKSANSDYVQADLIKPRLERAENTIILELTPEEWQKLNELDRGFAEQFEVFRMPEVDPATRVRILARTRMTIEQQTPTRIELDALLALEQWHGQFIRQLAEPGCSVGPLKRLAVKAGKDPVTAVMVKEDFRQLSGYALNEVESLDRAHINAALRRHLVGQDAAVSVLEEVLLLFSARLYEPGRPVATLLFLGPTGVGKTQAGKATAHFVSESGDALLRLDMNEFVDPSASDRLIGSLDHPQGKLTNEIRLNPYRVILFDEIEKAHPSVHDLLLQMLGEGRLTDAMGKVADFSQSIIIMTSNLGARDAERQTGFAPGQGSGSTLQAETYREAAQRFFRPEMLNRIDHIVSFESLDRETAQQVARMHVANLLKREGFLRRPVLLHIDEYALAEVLDSGYDKSLGGRAIKREIESRVLTRAAEALSAADADELLWLRISARKGDDGQPQIQAEVDAPTSARSHSRRLPQIPTGSQRLDWLETRIDYCLGLRERIDHWRDTKALDESTDQRLFRIRDSIQQALAELEEELQRQDQKAHQWDPGTVPQLMRGVRSCDYSWHANTHYRQQKAAIEEIRSFLHELWSQAHPLPDIELQCRQSRLQLLEDSLDQLARQDRAPVAMQYQAASIDSAGRLDTLITMHRQGIAGLDSVELTGQERLPGQVLSLADLVDDSADSGDSPSGESRILLVHPSLGHVLEQEVGLHLFHEPGGAIIGIMVSPLKLPKKADPHAWLKQSRHWRQWADLDHCRIIRRYAMPDGQGYRGRKDQSITDLRTGLSLLPSELTPAHWHLLWAAR